MAFAATAVSGFSKVVAGFKSSSQKKVFGPSLRFISSNAKDDLKTANIINISKTLKNIRTENDLLKNRPGSEEYDFMTKVHVATLDMENTYGNECTESILKTLQDPTFDGPGARVLLGSLSRLTPTTQSLFEKSLAKNPSWEINQQKPNPQDPYPQELKAAQIAAKKTNFICSEGVFKSLERTLNSKHPDVVLAALDTCSTVGDTRLIEMCKKHINSQNKIIRSSAIAACAELSHYDSKTQKFFREFLNSQATIQEKCIAFEAFADAFPSEESKKTILEIVNDPNLKEFVQSQNFLTELLDLPREDLRGTVEELVRKHDISKLKTATLLRLERSRMVDHQIKSLVTKALKTNETRSLDGSRYGLLVHRDSKWFFGHAGIFVSEDHVIDVTVGRDKQACQEISFHEWKEGQDCWGIRAEKKHHHRPRANLDLAVADAKKHASFRCVYNWNHMHQKGKWHHKHSNSRKYWEADCVGFTEHTYEKAGGDPVKREDERPMLTPKKQRDNMDKVMSC